MGAQENARGDIMAKQSGSQLAAQLYTVREHAGTPKAIARTLKRVRKIGYQSVQLSGLGPIDPCELKSMLDDAGLQAIGHHTSMDQLRNDLVGLIDMLHCWNCDYTAVAYLADSERKTAAAWKARAKEMSRFGAELVKEGITLQYHNHSFEFMRYSNGTCGLELLYEHSDPKCLQAEIDTYWVAHGLADPVAWCERLKGRLDQVHFKDGCIDEKTGTHRFCEVGTGNLNWPAIIKACKSSGTRHFIVEQDAHWKGKNPFKSLEISYKNLRELGLR